MERQKGSPLPRITDANDGDISTTRPISMPLPVRSFALGAALLFYAFAAAAAQGERKQTSPKPSATPTAQGQQQTTGNLKRQTADAKAKPQPDSSTRIEIYGFAQGDMIYDFEQNNPDWFDVNRPSKLPAFHHEFGGDNRTWFSARQTRFGAKATIPTSGPDVKVVFDWDLFGVGVDAGQTTIRPRHMYGQWGKFGGGQLESPFMDVDVFPNVLDYWGPNGMLFFRNVQLFWQPINKPNGTRATIALERPGASGDGGVFSDRIELQNIAARFPAPDISAEYRWGTGFGYVELAGIVRWMRWDDQLQDAFDLSGGTTGWGLSFSSNYRASRSNVIRFQVIEGAGVENYFNDAPVDVGVETQPANIRTPITGKALGDFGLSAYLDHQWNSRFSSALGYSRVDIDNSDAQRGDAFKTGQYASVNLLWTPVPNVMLGGEFQWAYRGNHSDGFHSSDYRMQVSAKYSFSQKFGVSGHDVTRAQ